MFSLCSYLYNPRIAPTACSSSFSTVRCAMFTACTFAKCNVKVSVCSLQHNVQCVQCTVYSTLCAVCSVLLPSGGIIASNTNQPSSGSLRIIGQLDLFNQRIIGQKIMGRQIPNCYLQMGHWALWVKECSRSWKLLERELKLIQIQIQLSGQRVNAESY